MKELLILFLLVYGVTLLFSAFVAVFRFFIDIGKWHDREERVKIKSSRMIFEESEVEDNGRNDNGNDRDSDRESGDSEPGDGESDSDRDSCRSPLEF